MNPPARSQPDRPAPAAAADPKAEAYTVVVLLSGMPGLPQAILPGPPAAARQPAAFTCTLPVAALEAGWDPDPDAEGLERVAEWMFTVGNLEPDDLEDATARRVAADYRRCGLRSVSVGDRIRVTAPDGTTELWRCASAGWDLLERNGQPTPMDPAGAGEPAAWMDAAEPW